MSNQKKFILFDILNGGKKNEFESFVLVQQHLRKSFKHVILNTKKSQVLVKLSDGDDYEKLKKNHQLNQSGNEIYLIVTDLVDSDSTLAGTALNQSNIGLIKTKFEEKSIEKILNTHFGISDIETKNDLLMVKGINIQIQFLKDFMISLLNDQAIIIEDKSIPIRKTDPVIDSAKNNMEQSTENKRKAEDKRFYVFIGAIKVLAYQESIVNVDADAIINSIDILMSFRNRVGLCKAVYDKFGQSLETECKRMAALEFKNQINVGDCIMVKSGRTKPKFIINAISPDAGFPKFSQVLEKTFINIFEKASSCNEIKNLAMPLISTGVNGVSKTLCAKLLINIIKQQANQLNLAEIHLVNIDLESTNILMNELISYDQTSVLRDQINTHKLQSSSRSIDNKQPKIKHYKSEDNGHAKCDRCGQRIRMYIESLNCNHVYCMGCRIDYKANNCKCLINDLTPSLIDSFEKISKINQKENETSIDNRKVSIDVNSNEISNKIFEASSNQETKLETKVCGICFDFESTRKLTKCPHELCELCYKKIMQSNSPKCPFCFVIYGVIKGNQPKNGTMTTSVENIHLPGFNNVKTIVINYLIPSGVQGENHPSPGQAYTGINRKAYLPDNAEGRHILNLLKKAFDNGLIFTIGTSRTTNREGITWNDIHHKTDISGPFGYPDVDYLNRVKSELKDRGIE